MCIGFTAPKIMWLKKFEENNFKKTAKIMLPHDFINFYLSGSSVYAMERGDASGTGLFSVAANGFDRRLMDFIDPTLFAKFPSSLAVAEPHAAIGTVDVSVLMQLFPGYDFASQDPVLIAPGCGDNAMSTLGINSVYSATATDTATAGSPIIVSLGTSGTIASSLEVPVTDPSGGVASFCDATGKYLPLICIQNCALVPEEIRHSFGSKAETDTAAEGVGNVSLNILSIDEITDLAKMEAPGCEDVCLLPYFSHGGERTPNWPDCTGSFLGLRHGHLQRPGLLYRAALESVSFALLRGYRNMQKLLMGTGAGISTSGGMMVSPSQICLVGGAAKNPVWSQIIADIFQLPVFVHASAVASNAGAIGAVVQACAIYNQVKVGAVAMIAPENCPQIYQPTSDPEVIRVYELAFARHCDLSNRLFS